MFFFGCWPQKGQLDYKEILLKIQAINQKPTVHFLMLFKITSLKYIQYTGVINTVQGLILPTYAIQNLPILQPCTQDYLRSLADPFWLRCAKVFNIKTLFYES